MAKLGSKFEQDTQEKVEKHTSWILWGKNKLSLMFGIKFYAFKD